MSYGHFDDRKREYVIEGPDTPLPWINYLGTEAYFGIISNTAGGYSFYKDARLRRLIRYRYNNAPLDSGGRYIYLRDENSAAHPSGLEKTEGIKTGFRNPVRKSPKNSFQLKGVFCSCSV